MTTTEELIATVKSLLAEEQTAVGRFIDYPRLRVPTRTPFPEAAEEFIAQHPELLRRLAQRPSIRQRPMSFRFTAR